MSPFLTIALTQTNLNRLMCRDQPADCRVPCSASENLSEFSFSSEPSRERHYSGPPKLNWAKPLKWSANAYSWAATECFNICLTLRCSWENNNRLMCQCEIQGQPRALCCFIQGLFHLKGCFHPVIITFRRAAHFQLRVASAERQLSGSI